MNRKKSSYISRSYIERRSLCLLSHTHSLSAMAENEIVFDIPPLLRVYKDGKIERFSRDPLPAGHDPITGVQSKDVQIPLPETTISARLYLPKTTNPDSKKLPLLVYIHGGGFIAESAFSPTYHPYLNSLSSSSQSVIVSVEYRLAPEHPLPAAYEDSWAVVKWAASHGSGSGPEPWLNQFVDFEKVFFAGDSAGANIAHYMGIRAGLDPGEVGLKLVGIVLVHPFFGGVEAIGGEGVDAKGFADKLWAYAKPGTCGSDDPEFNPGKDPRVKGMGCERVLVCVGGKDYLKDRGWYYGEVLGKSGWGGKVEVVEDKEEDHVFHLMKPDTENAVAMMNRVVAFIKGP